MFPQVELTDSSGLMKIAVIIAVFLGLIAAIFFIVIQKESYSAIYFVPDSITHDTVENAVFFTYGIKSSETGKMDYTLNTFAEKTLLKTRTFSLNQGEIFEERVKITIPPDMNYPLKISLKMTTNAATEEIHFWLPEVRQ